MATYLRPSDESASYLKNSLNLIVCTKFVASGRSDVRMALLNSRTMAANYSHHLRLLNDEVSIILQSLDVDLANSQSIATPRPISRTNLFALSLHKFVPLQSMHAVCLRIN